MNKEHRLAMEKMSSTHVVCSECEEHQETEKVKFLDIEEDMQGRDVMKFVCPVTNKPTKSLVYNTLFGAAF